MYATAGVNVTPDRMNAMPDGVNAMPGGINAMPGGINAMPDRVNATVGRIHAMPCHVNPIRGGKVTPQASTPRFEQLDRIAVGVEQLDLLSARPALHLVAELQAVALEVGDDRGQIVHT